jgi:hypothetical protein
MSYFPDLSAYSYCQSFAKPGTYNVGWLDRSYAFPTGQVPKAFVTNLWNYCQNTVLRMRGFTGQSAPRTGPLDIVRRFLVSCLTLGKHKEY